MDQDKGVPSSTAGLSPTVEPVPVSPPQQLPILAAQMVAVDQGCEALRRTRRIMDRCYPNVPVGNPFVNAGERAWMMSPERGDYVLLQRRMFREIECRILAKIVTRDAEVRSEDIARPAQSYEPARAVA